MYYDRETFLVSVDKAEKKLDKAVRCAKKEGLKSVSETGFFSYKTRRQA